MDKSLRDTILSSLREYSTQERPIYLVGGAVRDLLLDRLVHDLDFVLPGETRRLAQEIARRLNGALYVMDEERDTTRVVLDAEKTPGLLPGERMMLDFASFRAADFAGDLQARDFRINAMAFDVAQPERLIDPLGGLADLRAKRIAACAPDSLSQDPVRVLRAVRLALGLGFSIDPETLRLMRAAAPLLPQISAERLRDELFKMLDGQQVALAFRILDRAGALRYVLPELDGLQGVDQSAPHTMNVWEHTLSTVQYLEQLLPPLVGRYREDTVADITTGSAVLWLGRFRNYFEEHFSRQVVPDRSVRAGLFLAALYHDIAKPAVRDVTPGGKIRFLGHPEKGAPVVAELGQRLALSTQEIGYLDITVCHHMRVHFMANSFRDGKDRNLTRRTIYRFFKDTGVCGINICLLSLADTRGTYGAALPQDVWQSELQTCRLLLEAYWEKTEAVVSPRRLLTGNDLISAFCLKPGRIIGQLLGAIRESQAAGEITDREEVLAFARRWLDGDAQQEERPANWDINEQECEG